MPITAFSNFTDGLDPNRRSREHFITNINLEDDRLWVPYANGVWFQPCSFNVTAGGIQRCSQRSPWLYGGNSLPCWHRSWLYDAWSLAIPGARLDRKARNLHLRTCRRGSHAGDYRGLTGTHDDAVRSWWRPHLSGQGGEWWLCRLRGWIHSSRADPELLSRGRSGCAPAGSASSLSII